MYTATIWTKLKKIITYLTCTVKFPDTFQQLNDFQVLLMGPIVFPEYSTPVLALHSLELSSIVKQRYQTYISLHYHFTNYVDKNLSHETWTWPSLDINKGTFCKVQHPRGNNPFSVHLQYRAVCSLLLHFYRYDFHICCRRNAWRCYVMHI